MTNQQTMPEMINSGKVRDTYPLDDDRRMLVVVSDRISTYDWVHPTPIPGKGVILNAVTEFWLTEAATASVMPNHLITTDLSELPDWAQQFQGRAMVVKKLDMIPLEAIVRGYITGSAWKSYQQHGTMNGVEMPKGMIEAQRLDRFTFTPSTKATEGHDENISIEQAVDLIGQDVADRIERVSLELYTLAHDHALARGIVLADTKFEFGIDPDSGELVLADEVLTMDSSRFWPEDEWRENPGKTPSSFDKQIVRDYAASTGWDKESPAPEIPDDVVELTRDKYVEGAERLIGFNPLAA
jgi:phosphoribosylaminoimidazole-succinocarboxamide synthase